MLGHRNAVSPTWCECSLDQGRRLGIGNSSALLPDTIGLCVATIRSRLAVRFHRNDDAGRRFLPAKPEQARDRQLDPPQKLANPPGTPISIADRDALASHARNRVQSHRDDRCEDSRRHVHHVAGQQRLTSRCLGEAQAESRSFAWPDPNRSDGSVFADPDVMSAGGGGADDASRAWAEGGHLPRAVRFSDSSDSGVPLAWWRTPALGR